MTHFLSCWLPPLLSSLRWFTLVRLFFLTLCSFSSLTHTSSFILSFFLPSASHTLSFFFFPSLSLSSFCLSLSVFPFFSFSHSHTLPVFLLHIPQHALEAKEVAEAHLRKELSEAQGLAHNSARRKEEEVRAELTGELERVRKESAERERSLQQTIRVSVVFSPSFEALP